MPEPIAHNTRLHCHSCSYLNKSTSSVFRNWVFLAHCSTVLAPVGVGAILVVAALEELTAALMDIDMEPAEQFWQGSIPYRLC